MGARAEVESSELGVASGMVVVVGRPHRRARGAIQCEKGSAFLEGW